MISEAIVAGTPLIASRVAGNIGLLGAGYAGFFEVGDTRELARLLHRAEVDAGFFAELRLLCERQAGIFDPSRERQAWSDLLKGLADHRFQG